MAVHDARAGEGELRQPLCLPGVGDPRWHPLTPASGPRSRGVLKATRSGKQADEPAACCGYARLVVCLVALYVCSVALQWVDASGGGVTHAVLINGGSHPHANPLSHLQHLQEMVALLESRGLPRQRLHLFTANGEDATLDLAVRDALPAAFGR